MFDILIIIVLIVVVVVDIIWTLRGKPLLKPGPLAKFMHPKLDNEE